MSLSGAAAAMGLPEDLVQRSAAARAAETGATVDEILAAWAGGEAVEAPSPGGEGGAVADATAAPADGQDEQDEQDEHKEAPEAAEPTPPTPVIETPEPAPAAAAPSRAPMPAEVTAAEAAHLPEVITVPTAGIRERTNFVIPRWLTALMLVAPLFALFALGGSSTGACGEATELGVDVISGDIVNCDGTEFTGGGAGGGSTDFIALGGEIYGGTGAAGVNCAGCHGANGQGSGAFPALTGVLTTFGACEDHELWVALGSSGWRDQVGPNYGDTNKLVTQGMPAFAGSLTEEQIAAVSAFERVRFGGANPDEALVDCGLAEAEGEDGEAPADGEIPADGEAPADDGETPTETPAEGGDAEAGAGL